MEEQLDPFDVRIHFDELRKHSGLESAKRAIPDWEEYTLPGDPYPIPRKVTEGGIPSSKSVKGNHGFLVDTNEEGWTEKFIAAVRSRSGESERSDED